MAPSRGSSRTPATLLALVLLLLVAFYDWVILVLPGWVAVISVYIIRRERGRRRAQAPATA